jgi:hypothetical protein
MNEIRWWTMADEGAQPGPEATPAELLGAEVLAELDQLLLAQAREGKVTAAVALARVVHGRLKQQAPVQVKGDDADLGRTLREVIAELEREVAELKKRVGGG